MRTTDFGVWTLTTALFNTLGNKAAAKGRPCADCHATQSLLNNIPATIPFIFIFYFFYDIAYTPMLVAYTLEILPFNIRAKGFAVMVCHCTDTALKPMLTSLYRINTDPRSVTDTCIQPICEPMGSRCPRMEICEPPSIFIRTYALLTSRTSVPRLLRLAHHRTGVRRRLHHRNKGPNLGRNRRAL